MHEVRKNPVLAVIAVVIILLVVFVVIFVWNFEKHDVLRSLALVVAALGGLFIGLPLAVWRSTIASKQAQTAEMGHNFDRYQRGAAMLSDKRLSVRQAGIMALEKTGKAKSRRICGYGH